MTSLSSIPLWSNCTDLNGDFFHCSHTEQIRERIETRPARWYMIEMTLASDCNPSSIACRRSFNWNKREVDCLALARSHLPQSRQCTRQTTNEYFSSNFHIHQIDLWFTQTFERSIGREWLGWKKVPNFRTCFIGFSAIYDKNRVWFIRSMQSNLPTHTLNTRWKVFSHVSPIHCRCFLSISLAEKKPQGYKDEAIPISNQNQLLHHFRFIHSPCKPKHRAITAQNLRTPIPNKRI